MLGEAAYEQVYPDRWFRAHAVHDGELVIGGDFVNGWNNTHNDLVAAWDGTAWHPLDQGLWGTGVRELHVHGGGLRRAGPEGAIVA